MISILPHFTPLQWLLAALAALSVGISKSGFGGFGMVTVLLMAEIMPARQSTGAVLPLLIFGDILAVAVFRKHAQWRHIFRMLPPAVLGVIAGWLFMRLTVPDKAFRGVIGGIVLLLTALHCLRQWRPRLFTHVPHRAWFAWTIGVWSGVTTMLANAAGPIMTLYLLAVGLPKWEFVGTAAFFFLVVNLVKVPFSVSLGLINNVSLLFNVVLVPFVALGIFTGRKLIGIVPQKLFEQLVLIFAAAAAIRLIFESL